MRRLVSPPNLRRLGAALAGLALSFGLGLASPAAADSLPGPPLDAGPTPGAYCLPRGDDALGAAGFAGAIAAIALVARRRRGAS